MAQTLTNERSLLRRQEVIEKELNFLKRMRILEWSAAAAFILFGLIWKFVVEGSPFPLVVGGGLLFLALGHEARRKESMQEHADTQSMRSAKEEMAKLLDEKLANDHFILNDLRLKSGREKCWIDHLIVAPSGMFVINTLNWSGKIIGDTSKKSYTWKIRAADGSTRPARNPIGRVLRERRLLCNWLKGTQLIWERVHPLVVIADPDADVQVTNAEKRVVSPEEAVTFINDFCFEKPILSNEEVQSLAAGLNEQQD